MTTPGGPYADTRDMYMVHTMLRREFALLPPLVRDVTAGDEERTQIVADHIEFLGTILHAHHHSEDVYLWPKLLDRGSEEIVPIIHLMEGQHTSIEKINAEVTAAAGSWRGSSAAGNSEALAETLDRLVRVLNEHMGLEELNVLPIARKCVAAAEWEQMAGETGRGIPPEKSPWCLACRCTRAILTLSRKPFRECLQKCARRWRS
jgi:hemerythrin-like domain-containing protein